MQNWTVNEVVEHCISAYKFEQHGTPTIDPDKIEAAIARFGRFDSMEAYTPVFDLNAKELRNLDVKVLTNVTAFYSYWKATRDAYRRLASVSAAWKAHEETLEFLAQRDAERRLHAIPGVRERTQGGPRPH